MSLQKARRRAGGQAGRRGVSSRFPPSSPPRRLLDPCRSRDGKRQRLDGDFVVAGVETGALDLERPGTLEVPASDFAMRLIIEDDRAVLLRILELPVLNLFAPLPHVLVGGKAA